VPFRESFRRSAQAVQGIKPMAGKYGLSIYQLVLAATLMHPAIQVAVVGIKTKEQITEAAAAIGKRISAEDWHQLRKALNTADFVRIKDGTGKAK